MDSIGNENEQISYLRAKVINALINKSIELYKKI
jgi:dGTPase